jgi:hypothetical protein
VRSERIANDQRFKAFIPKGRMVKELQIVVVTVDRKEI